MKGLLALMLVLALAMSVDARAESSPQSLRVFLDCGFCDSRFIKDELPIVDFLNERTQADVHILHASQRTGGGGRRITLTFLGQRDYAELSDTFDYATRSDATRDDRRRALLHHLTIGLSRYLAHAGLSDKLTISAVRPSAEDLPASSIEDDPWDYWVFSFGGGGSVNGQETTRFTSQRANFSADRTTEALKIRVNGNINESKSELDVGDENIVSKNNTDRLSAQVVKSIGEQWAVGGTTSVSSSSFRNTERQMEIGPTIEYDFFPYSQSTRRLLTVQYNLRLSKREYDELTIFALDEETLLQHSIAVSLSLAQKWGNVSVSASFNQMLTNFDRNLSDSYNFGLFGSANVRLYRGLSFNVFANYSRIKDQIYLPSTEATRDEILLRSVQLPTGYSFFVNFGLTYRFGSIFNNVVNPRMSGGGGIQQNIIIFN